MINIKNRFYLMTLLVVMAPIYGSGSEDEDITAYIDLPAMSEIIDHPETWQTRASCDAASLVGLLTELGIIGLLEEDFFHRTTDIANRDVITLPSFLMNKNYIGDWNLSTNIFYNQTNYANFTKDSTSIASYLAVLNGQFMDKLEKIIEKISDLIGTDILEGINLDEISELFASFTVQQRRVGLLFEGRRAYDTWCFEFKLPFYYLERNFFTNKPQEDRIRELIAQTFGAVDKSLEDNFANAHLISDKLGFGDARLNFDFNVGAWPSWSLDLGAQITIPTAFAIAKGLRGTSFEKCMRRNDLDFCLLFNEGVAKNFVESGPMLERFFIGAIDHLASNLLDSTLGNNGHFGLGFVLTTKTNLGSCLNCKWAEKWTWHGRLSADYYFPAIERRFFIQKNDPAEFASRDFNNADQAQDNLNFLMTKLTDRLYPYVFNTSVHPGMEFQWSGRFQYESNRLGAYFGSDWWIKTKESFGSIEATHPVLNSLNICKAIKPLAFQSKFLAGLFFKFHRSPTKDVIISLNGDVTGWNSGIGGDYTLTLNFETTF